MIHQPSGGARGQTTDLAIEAKEILKVKSRIAKLISEATGKDLKEVEENIERNYWLDSKEAVEYGIVNKIITSYDELIL